jgi:hypothetical protein
LGPVDLPGGISPWGFTGENIMLSSNIRIVLLASAMVLGATAANASVSVFDGNDDGVNIGDPYPNSDAAHAVFTAAAAAYGTVATETFESKALGFYSPIPIAGGAIVLGADDYGDGFSGVSVTSFGSLYGFNTTPGGSKWLGFPAGEATFMFNGPTNSFGFYMTGVQTSFTTSLVVTLLDGSESTFDVPIDVAGGVSFFGIVDTQGFTKISITDLGGDAWGIDDVSYNGTVPEPASWALMIVGFGLVGVSARRRRPVTA